MVNVVLCDINLLDGQGMRNTSRLTAGRIPIVVIVLGILAAALVTYLIWDFVHQKLVEARERRFLAHFRAARSKQSPPPALRDPKG